MSDSLAQSWLDKVQRALQEVSAADLETATELLGRARVTGRRVFLMGNGGSAACAAHLACDLNKACDESPPPFATSLSDNVPLLTALANDLDYSQVFSEQLRHVEPGDVAVVISVSGGSRNVVRAAAAMREQGGAVIGLLGSGGGEVGPHCDVALSVTSAEFGVVEGVHGVLAHLIAELLSQRITEGKE